MNSFKTPKGTELPLLDLRGKDYLQVAHRVQWFREEKPEWSIETEFVQQTEIFSLAKAIIKNEAGRIIATAHKHETKQGFADHREKAESGAIGRALALIGYGTQFAQELEEGERIVDTPHVKTRTEAPSAPKIPQIPKQGVAAEVKPQSGKYADYTLKSGKNKGKTLRDIGVGQAKTYEMWLTEKAASSSGIPMNANNDLVAIGAFLKEIHDKPSTTKTISPKIDPDEEMPSFDSDETVPF